MKEYTIWGIPPHKTEEELLLTQHKGKLITDKVIAEGMAVLLTEKIGCSKVRIQEIDLTEKPDFIKTF